MSDNVNHPKHYTQHPSGVECIQITEHMGFCVGNAIKYLWRHEQKGGVEDLKKARWYIDREIGRQEWLDKQDDPDTIDDGHGNAWDRWCPDCGAEMEIVRPGKVQCSEGCKRLDT
jgi:hypothetical protein